MGRNKAGQTMSDEHNSSKDRYNPEVEKQLRQFLTLESCQAATAGYRSAYEDSFGVAEPLPAPLKCQSCDYVASTRAECRHHNRMCREHYFESPDPHYVKGLSRCLAVAGSAQCDQTDGHEGLHTAGPGKSWGL